MKKENRFLVIAAAGSGNRLEADIPKQYLKINGRPLIIWAIKAFLPFIKIENIIITISKSHQHFWNKLKNDYVELQKMNTVYGGPERFHSVMAALKLVPERGTVAIHDAARPLVSNLTISNCFQLAEIKGNAIPVAKVRNSIRLLENGANKNLEREKLREVQTPQVFKSSIIKKAYNINHFGFFTDDATVLEYAGHKIHLCEGNDENIKITTKTDLILAEIILKDRALSN
jgi:2-C-methyl-D-erythritol 4-phosphate cytidylyltransferase